jgi:hypothetical protein
VALREDISLGWRRQNYRHRLRMDHADFSVRVGRIARVNALMAVWPVVML